jgi:hypothetical protein
VRNAYLLTKVAVLAAAAVATVPLARVVGVRAWYGLGVFALILSLMTVAALAVGAAAGRPEGDDEASDSEGDTEDLGGPEAAADTVVELQIEDSLDLHSFPPAVVPQVVEDYLAEARARGFLEVRLIHGRGIGVQRERVRRLLARHPLVESYADAPPDRGGWGATVAVLRRDR